MDENTTAKKYLSLDGLTEYDGLIKAWHQTEMDNLITTDDIDTICGTTIYMIDEVEF